MKPSFPITPGHALAAAIAEQAPPDRIAKVLADGLSSTVTTRSGIIEPDTKSRLQAANLLLAYSVGRPVERIESVNVNLDADNSLGLEERLKNSPALRQALSKILANCDGGA